MRYKEDWEAAKKRLTAFWNHDIIDRCCINVKAYNVTGKMPVFDPPRTEEEIIRCWTDPEMIIRGNRLAMENNFYGGESFPMISLNLGASGHAGFFKGEKHKITNSVWFFPFMDDLEHMPEFDSDSFLYRKTIELAKAFAEDSAGDYIISMADTSGNADVLSHMMGADTLLTLMVEDPEGVSKCLRKIETVYEKIQSEVYGIVKENNEGGSCVGWLNIWAPGFLSQLQCDMSVMISNPMFKQFILPELQAQAKFLEYPLYHLDGIEQARHLDDLLSIPELKCIQWTQVVGQKPCTEYFDQLKKIQAAGKNLLICVGADQVQTIMENLSSRGLMLCTDVPTVDEANDLLKDVAKWTHD